jgi:hypothetical protein
MTESVQPIWQRRWAGPAVVTAVFLAMLFWTWQKWADVLIDFGVQLYVPWQLSEGKVLYRDIAHYTGPLSVYYNALAFRIFGVNLRVLELANLPILIAIVIIIYHLGTKLGGRFCATICAVSFLILFAFAHLTIAGNYNYVCPYEYEYTHATLFSLVSVIFLNRLVTSRRLINAAAAGFLAGMIFLTRAEFFVAAIGAAGIAITFLIVVDWRKVLPAAGIFFIAAIIPPIVSALLLHLAMPWNMAFYRMLGMWPAMLRGNVSRLLFYQHSMGLDDLPASLRLLEAWSVVWCIPLAAFASWGMLKIRRRSTPMIVIAFLLGAIFAGLHWRDQQWGSMFRPLPLAVALITAISGFQFFRCEKRESALAAILGVLSFILLAKVFFYARITHYGCWLAMPAVILLLATLFGTAPASIKQRGGNAPIFLAGLAGVWTVVLLVHLSITKTQMKPLDISVGSGSDQFWADAKIGNFVNNAVLVAQQMPPNKTLACFPEGIMINYLARRETATRFVNFNPPDLLLFGEDRMLAAMQTTPPDFIFLVHKDTSEFGLKFFGRDYGQKLYAWIEENYQPQDLPMIDLGAEPLRDTRFGIRLLIHRPSGDTSQRLIDNQRFPLVKYSLTADSTSTRE